MLLSNTPIYVVGGVMACSIVLKLHDFPDVERRGWFVTSDATGLVAFAVTGSLAGIEAGLPLFGVVALSLITAVGGGLLRDTLVGNRPLILQEGFYGSVAILLGTHATYTVRIRHAIPRSGGVSVRCGLRPTPRRSPWRVVAAKDRQITTRRDKRHV